MQLPLLQHTRMCWRQRWKQLPRHRAHFGLMSGTGGVGRCLSAIDAQVVRLASMHVARIHCRETWGCRVAADSVTQLAVGAASFHVQVLFPSDFTRSVNLLVQAAGGCADLREGSRHPEK